MTEQRLPRFFVMGDNPTDAERMAAGWVCCEQCGRWFWREARPAHLGLCQGGAT